MAFEFIYNIVSRVSAKLHIILNFSIRSRTDPLYTDPLYTVMKRTISTAPRLVRG